MAAKNRFKVFAFVPKDGWMEHGTAYPDPIKARDDAMKTFKAFAKITAFRVIDTKGEVKPKEYSMVTA